MNNKFPLVTLLIFSALFLISWGNSGHYKISLNISENLPEEMAEFHDWNVYLAEHGSDADWRKGDDPEEGPKHYIDVDNYSEFIETGKIDQDLEALIEKHGMSFIDNNGYLPWATLTSYDSLVSCFTRRDWDKAKFFAADLGHYVADGFMPLHITRNYNGQFTGNTGIHGRFESDMINKFKYEIEMSSMEIEEISSPSDYIFNYLYDSYEYVDSVIEADNYGKSINSNTSSNEYLDAMWDYSSDWTELLFNKASKAFASLFYNAWKEAGKPLISQTNLQEKHSENMKLLRVFPNPARSTITVDIHSSDLSEFGIHLFNTKGSILESQRVNNNHFPLNQISMDISDFQPGEYFLYLQSPQYNETKTFIIR